MPLNQLLAILARALSEFAIKHMLLFIFFLEVRLAIFIGTHDFPLLAIFSFMHFYLAFWEPAVAELAFLKCIFTVFAVTWHISSKQCSSTAFKWALQIRKRTGLFNVLGVIFVGYGFRASIGDVRALNMNALEVL